MIKQSALYLFFCLSGMGASAQTSSGDLPDLKPKKVTLSSGVEGSLLQFANVTVGGFNYKTIPRYTYFFNSGIDIDFHITPMFVPYTGFQLKNIGIITQSNDSVKFKERVYTIGAPVGIKLFSKNKKFMFKVGGDIALALNYKVKYFLHDKKMSKMNEFFSNKASLLFSSAFAGIYYNGFSLTGNYYLTNFYNTSVGTMYGRIFTVALGLHLDGNTLKMSKKKSSGSK